MLENVACAMQESFREWGCPAKVFFGQEHVAEHGSPPRVVWVTTRDMYEAPQQIMPNPVSYGPNIGLNPRTLATRWAGADLHIWGAGPTEEQPGRTQRERDQAAVDALINQVVLSLQKINPGNYRITGADCSAKVQNVRRGFVCILSVQIAIPIIEIPFPCEAIDVNDLTWPTENVGGDVTVEMRTSLPTGPLMDSVAIEIERS